MVNIPSFMVRVSSEQHIQLSATSSIKTGALGRQKKKRAAAEKWALIWIFEQTCWAERIFALAFKIQVFLV